MKRSLYTRRQACQLGLSGLLGVALLDFAGCDSSSTAGASETMQLSFWGDASRNKLTRNAITLFQQAHPGITIHSWFADFSTYFNKLNTQIAGGSTPDLIQMDISYVKQYVNEHILLDMTSLVANKTIDLSDFDQDMLANSEDNKVLYGIPLGGNYECMIYDTQLVQQAGVGAPPTTMTWAQFADYTANISKGLAANKVFGTADSSGAIDLFEIWVRQRGKELYTPDGQLAFNTDDVASWFDYWSGLRKSGACASAEIQAAVTGSGPSSSLLTQGKAAFATAHSNQFQGYQVLTTHPLALQQIPTGSGPGLYFKPSMLMSIAAKSKYVNDAASFINFVINDPKGLKALGLDRGIPGGTKARESLMSSLSATDKAVLDYADAVANSGQSRPRTILDPAGAGKIQTALGNAAQAVSFGKLSVTAGASSFYQDSLKALAQP
jgi:multiple sugar transport system substrate-binding protein